MSNENQEVHADAQEQEQRPKRQIPWKRIIGAVVLTLLVVAALGAFFYFRIILPGTHYTEYEVVMQKDRLGDPGTTYFSYGKNVAGYNKEGVFVVGPSGNVVWNAAYTMEHPKAEYAGNYIAVADIGSRRVIVYDGSGRGTEVSVLSPVIAHSVSEQGEVAVLMQKDDAYHIQLIDPYDAAVVLKAEILTYVEDDGFALSIALSKDGAKLVTEYFTSDGNQLKSTLTFYSFTSVGENANADRIVGIFPYEDVLFPEVRFLTNDLVCAYGDNRLVMFQMSQIPKLLWEKTYDGEILYTAGSENLVALLVEEEARHGTNVVTDGLAESEEAENGEDGAAADDAKTEDSEKGSAAEEDPNRIDADFTGERGIMLYAFGTDGGTFAKKRIDINAMDLQVGKDDVILYSDETCVIYRKGGQEKFRGSFSQNLQCVFPGSSENHYYVISGKYMEQMRLAR